MSLLDQAEIDAEVKTLLSLKADYKSPETTSAPSGQAADLNTKITAQGDKVRDLKAKKATKVNLNYNSLMLNMIFDKNSFVLLGFFSLYFKSFTLKVTQSSFI